MDSKQQIEEKIPGIVSKVERECGVKLTFDETIKILTYTVRKCEINGKGDDYIPILFENELTDFLMRREINRMGEFNRCVKSAIALPV